MSKVIELTDVIEEKKSKGKLRYRLLFFLLKLGVTIGVTVWLSFYILVAYQIAKDRVLSLYSRMIGALTRIEIVTEYVPKQALPIEQLIDVISRERKVPSVVLKAIVNKESSGGKNLYRFEPKVFARLSSKSGGSDETRMLSSSHGVAQVMGFNAKPRCQLHWSELYDTYQGLDCGARILKDELNRVNPSQPIGQRIWQALRNYNGSGDMAENYADTVMSEVGKLLINNLKEEL